MNGEINKLFYTIGAVTKPFKDALAESEALVKKTVSGLSSPIVLKISASNVDLTSALNQAKKAIADAGFDPERDRVLLAKLDAEVSGFEAKLKASDVLLERLIDEPHTVSLLANADAMNATLKGAETKALQLAATISGAFDQVAADQEKAAAQVEAHTQLRGKVEAAAYREDQQRAENAQKAVASEQAKRQKADAAREAAVQRIGRLEAAAYQEDQQRTARSIAAVERKTRAMALLEIEAHKLNDAFDAGDRTAFEQLIEGAKDADLSIQGLARTAVNALKQPTIAAGVLAAAIVKIAYEATQAASAFRDAFLPVASTLGLSVEATEALQESITELSTNTPRTAESLAKVAGSLAKMGESDPAEIARDVETLALAGDALGKTDLEPLAETLDLLGDAFHLTAQEARQAFIQVAAITQGKIDIQEFGDVLGKSAPRLKTLGIDAQQAASAITTLVDAGVNGRQVTTGLIDLLDRASTAEQDALEAAATGRDGDARLLQLFAKTVNATTIESRGLVGALGDLFRAFEGNTKLFDQAKLSVNSMAIAQVSANAASADGKTDVLSYAESLDKLKKAAETNRDSAAALAQILKNDLSAVLVDIGNIVLPTVLTAMTALVNLFSRGRAEASGFAADLKKLPGLQKGGPGDVSVLSQNNSLTARNRIVQNSTQRINANPDILIGKTTDELVRLQQEFARFLDDTGGITKAGPITKALDEITKAIVAQTTAADMGAIAAASKAAAEAKAAAGARAYANSSAEAKKAAEDFRSLTKAGNEFADALGNVSDPIGMAQAKIAALVAEMEALVPKLKESEQAVARNAIAKFADNAAKGLERLKSVNLADLQKQMRQLVGVLNETASDVIIAQYDEQIAKLRDLAAQAGKSGDALAGLAAEYDIKRLEARRDALADLAKRETAIAKAVEIATRGQQQSDAAYRGLSVSVDEYKDALAFLATQESDLKRIAEDATQADEVRAIATAKLNKLIADRNVLLGIGTNTGTSKPVDDTNLLAAGLLAASNNAAALASNLGESGNRLAQLAALGIKVGNVLKAVQVSESLSKSSTATTAQKTAAKTDIIAMVVSLGVEYFSALDVFGSKAKKRTRELRTLAAEFNDALAEFAITERTDLQEALRQNLRATDPLIAKAAEQAGIKSLKNFNAQSPDDIRAEIAKQRQAAANFSRFDDKDSKRLAAGATSFANALQLILDELLKNEAKLTAAHDKQVARNTDDLRVRSLVAQGRTEEAEALRLKLALDDEIEEAAKDQTESGKKYLAYLKEVQAEEIKAAEAAKRDPLKEFQNRAKLFGIAGADFLEGLAKSTAAKFSEVGEALAGLDLSTEAGIEALKERGKDLYNQFLANDGYISESEQAILDGLFNIYGTAVDVFDSIAERVGRAMSKLDTDNSILGGTSKEQLSRTLDASKGFSSALDDILGGIDFSSSAGIEAAKGKLRDLYISIASDGISESEQPIVDLIQSILGGLTAVWDEESAALDLAMTKAMEKRSERRSRAARANSVDDLEGLAAFLNELDALPEGVKSLFGQFNLETEAGVAGAKARLRQLNQEIEGLSDDEILARFGLTKSELLDVILDLDNGFDGLKAGLLSVADATLAASQATEDFLATVGDESLRLRGKDREADIEASKRRTNEKLEKGKELGVSQQVLDEIIANGLLEIKAINKRFDDQVAAEQERATPGWASDSAAPSRNSFVASGVTSISEQQALRLTDIASSQLLALRSIEGYVRALLSGRVPPPALPSGLGTFSQASPNGGNVFVTIQVSGNLSTKESARELARILAPEISIVQRSRASGLSALRGT